MKRIDINTVDPGDILFTARLGKLSKSIRFATKGIVSHAMICVQHGSFIDSTAEGVQARNLQRELFDDDELIFQFRLKDPVGREVLSKVHRLCAGRDRRALFLTRSDAVGCRHAKAEIKSPVLFSACGARL
ncbi:hypothetical protein [Sinorhizobium medicae]